MIQRRKPIARAALKRSTKPIPRRRAKPRRGPLRDPGYLAFLREEGRCPACSHDWRLRDFGGDTRHLGRLPCDPAHGPVNGKGSKGPDNEALPLCRVHHAEQHRLGWPAFEARYGFNRQRESEIWWSAYQGAK